MLTEEEVNYLYQETECNMIEDIIIELGENSNEF